MSGVIGTVIGLIIGFLVGSIAYLTGWSDGWDDCKKFMFTELDRNDEHIVSLVRTMAEKLRGGEDDES